MASSPLLELAQGSLSPSVIQGLSHQLTHDPIALPLSIDPTQTPQQTVLSRLELFKESWPAFKQSWPYSTDPLDPFWRVYLPLAQWLIEARRRLRPNGLFVFGINGSIGRGKTSFARLLVELLNLLTPVSEGRALARSLDDYYLPRRERMIPAYFERGYHVGDGISNRGPAGTHDVPLLTAQLWAMEERQATVIHLPTFDKQNDDRVETRTLFLGPVSFLILEGWFLGAHTQVDPTPLALGLKRSVAEALYTYRPIFDRVDMLWAYKTPSLEEIVRNRIHQQEMLDQESKTTGMNPEAIRRFVQYFYEQSWAPGLTSPVPLPTRVDFWVDTDAHYRFTSMQRGAHRTL